MKRCFLLSLDPTDGGGNPGGEKPPAADLVSKSKADEGEASEIVRRRRELDDREKKLKEREMAQAEKEDRARREKEARDADEKSKAEKQKRSWIYGVLD
jgi:Skp family chaperone for outer membrane proteins